jgi:DnaJ like chaperone protein
VWGKIIGGVAGFAVGGPFGAVAGLALGHAAESGGLGRIGSAGMNAVGGLLGPGVAGRLRPALFGAPAALGRDQVFAIGVVVIAAKLCKCDGAVNRAEIDAFKRHFHAPPESARDVGRLFDQARDSPEGAEGYALHMGAAFGDNHGMLEDVLAALFAIARADKPLNGAEQAFLEEVWRGFGLGQEAWDRASGRSRASWASTAEDPYQVLGVKPDIADDALRAAWKQLMRENHPDTLASRGVPQEFVARASDKVARINAAWDIIKRQRGL